MRPYRTNWTTDWEPQCFTRYTGYLPDVTITKPALMWFYQILRSMCLKPQYYY